MSDLFDSLIFQICWYAVCVIVAFYCYIKGVKVSQYAEQCEKDLEDAQKDLKMLKDGKERLENSLLLLKDRKLVTKKLQLAKNCYKLVTNVDIPLEVFVYPSDSPMINESVKEEIALSIAKEMLDDNILTIEWSDDGLNMLRHAQACIKVMNVREEHWF